MLINVLHFVYYNFFNIGWFVEIIKLCYKLIIHLLFQTLLTECLQIITDKHCELLWNDVWFQEDVWNTPWIVIVLIRNLGLQG